MCEASDSTANSGINKEQGDGEGSGEGWCCFYLRRRGRLALNPPGSPLTWHARRSVFLNPLISDLVKSPQKALGGGKTQRVDEHSVSHWSELITFVAAS